MSWFSRFARLFEPLAIPHLARYLSIGQALLLVATQMRLVDLGQCVLVPQWVMMGEWWRMVSFVFIPPVPSSNIGLIFSALSIYLVYLYGTALEQIWGTARFNGFMAIGYLLTVAAAFLSPGSVGTNFFIYLSCFLAFAYLNPELEMYVFFVLPVKIKWIAAVTWAFQIASFVRGDWGERLSIAAAVGSFLLFFGGDIVRRFSGTALSLPRAASARGAPSTSGFRHRCKVCGRTDVSHPQLEFRYSADDSCYCLEHLRERTLIPPSSGDSR